MMNKYRKLLILAALVAVLAGCSADAGNVAITHEVTATDNEFEPGALTINTGETVRLVLNNRGAQEHDLTIDGAKGKVKVVSESGSHGASHSHKSLHVSAAAGETGALDFTPSEAGTYEFYCSVPGHKEAGMSGKLVVQ